jgi:hypothetical protein
MHLVLLTFALVLFIVSATLAPGYEPWRWRALCLGLAAWIAASYPF